MDLALGKVDYYEALGFVDDPMATAHVWYRALNCGFRLPAGAGTDAMANFASLRGPVGMNRVYVRTGGAVDQRILLDSLRAGRTFATNGPLLELTVDGRGPGQELRLGSGEHEVRARVSLRSNVAVDHLEIVGQGQVVAEIPLGGDRTRADTTVRLVVRGSGWFLLRARSDRAIYPVLDLYPYATTSPVYVTVAGAARTVGGGRGLFPALDRSGRGVRQGQQRLEHGFGKGRGADADREGARGVRAEEIDAGLVLPAPAVQSPSRSPVIRRCTS